jgi:hypothetical protein
MVHMWQLGDFEGLSHLLQWGAAAGLTSVKLSSLFLQSHLTSVKGSDVK